MRLRTNIAVQVSLKVLFLRLFNAFIWRVYCSLNGLNGLNFRGLTDSQLVVFQTEAHSATGGEWECLALTPTGICARKSLALSRCLAKLYAHCAFESTASTQVLLHRGNNEVTIPPLSNMQRLLSHGCSMQLRVRYILN